MVRGIGSATGRAASCLGAAFTAAKPARILNTQKRINFSNEFFISLNSLKLFLKDEGNYEPLSKDEK
jgi:hypothetical protein